MAISNPRERCWTSLYLPPGDCPRGFIEVRAVVISPSAVPPPQRCANGADISGPLLSPRGKEDLVVSDVGSRKKSYFGPFVKSGRALSSASIGVPSLLVGIYCALGSPRAWSCDDARGRGGRVSVGGTHAATCGQEVFACTPSPTTLAVGGPLGPLADDMIRGSHQRYVAFSSMANSGGGES